MCAMSRRVTALLVVEMSNVDDDDDDDVTTGALLPFAILGDDSDYESANGFFSVTSSGPTIE